MQTQRSSFARRLSPTVICAAAIAAFLPSLRAATSIWDANVGGNWSDATKWTPAGVPASGSDLLFRDANPLGFTAANDLAAPFPLHSLTVDALYGAQIAAQFLTVGGNQVALSGGGAHVAQAGDAGATIAVPISLGGPVSIDGAGQGALFLNGAITGSGPLTVARTGAGHTVLGAANGFTGGVVLQSGALALNDPAALGSGAFTINGGTVRMNQFVGPSGLAIANNLTANSTFTFVGNNSGIFTGVVSGAGGVTNASAVGVTLRLQGTNTYSGATLAAISPSTSSGTTITLEANGSALDSTGFDTLDVEGAVAFAGGTFTVALDDLDATQPLASYTILSADSFTGTLPTFALDFTNAPTWAGLPLSVQQIGTEIRIVPEPASAALLAIGAGLLAARRRRPAPRR